MPVEMWVSSMIQRVVVNIREVWMRCRCTSFHVLGVSEAAFRGAVELASCVLRRTGE